MHRSSAGSSNRNSIFKATDCDKYWDQLCTLKAIKVVAGLLLADLMQYEFMASKCGKDNDEPSVSDESYV